VTPEYLEKLARPEEVEVSSVPEFLAVIQDAVPNGADGSPDFDSFIYRGVADSLSHKLVPSLFRNPKILEDFSVGEGLTKWGVLEQSLLRRFKEGARPYLSIAPKDDIEWLILARHHGLPTRVMDWSKNPLVALHFAIDGDHAESPAVWQAMLWRAALVGQTYSLVQLNVSVR